jgi:hypothetical protein
MTPRRGPQAAPRRDTGPGAEGWLDTAPPDLSGVGWLLLGLFGAGAAGLFALLWLAVRGWPR